MDVRGLRTDVRGHRLAVRRRLRSGWTAPCRQGRPPGGPLVLLHSADLNETQRAIVDAGGVVTQGPYEFPGGRRLHFTDPTGNELGVWASQ